MSTLGPELEQTLGLMGELVGELQRFDKQLTQLGSMGRVREIVQALGMRPNVTHLPTVLLKVYNEIMEALHGIRLSRETIQSYSLDRLKDTHDRLSEVSSTTESAALEMLNGLDRSLAAIDQLQSAVNAGDATTHAPGFDALRDEVNNLYGSLQFQDIITQKLHGVTALLADIERRMQTVANLLDHSGQEGEGRHALEAPAEETYNANATMHDAAGRQALADAVLSAARAEVAVPGAA
ncbi:MAG: hypothetical protein NW201_08335 [Gemmatimonadales bacterium]|nr:hypothetical protein [Gemmatimonadales bacterium]